MNRRSTGKEMLDTAHGAYRQSKTPGAMQRYENGENTEGRSSPIQRPRLRATPRPPCACEFCVCTSVPADVKNTRACRQSARALRAKEKDNRPAAAAKSSFESSSKVSRAMRGAYPSRRRDMLLHAAIKFGHVVKYRDHHQRPAC